MNTPGDALELVVKLAKEGWHLQCGPHMPFTGYYATFFRNDDDYQCMECGTNNGKNSWDDFSHAHSLTDAILMAAHRATGTDYGVSHTDRQPEYFR